MTKKQIQGDFIGGGNKEKKKKGRQNMSGWLRDLSGRDKK